MNLEDFNQILAYQNMIIGWGSILAGVVFGALIGLFFHRDGWLGGYNTFQRRMVRLAHVSFLGVGILNLLYAMTFIEFNLEATWARTARWGFIIATTMPICCLLSAWKKQFRHIFPIPVCSVLYGIICLFGALFLK